MDISQPYDTELKRIELKRWRHNETQLVILQDDIRSCYTMQLIKNGQLISEISREDVPSVGQMICLLMDEVPIDPKHIKLN